MQDDERLGALVSEERDMTASDFQPRISDADAPTLVLTREFIASRMESSAYVAAVHGAFEQFAQGQIDVPSVGHVRGFDGAFHIKSATGSTSPRRAVVKLNANFPANPSRYGLPTIQGVIALFDADRGSLLALMDSVEVTAQRTAAASVVAARLLAKVQASRLAFIGCGMQAHYHLAAFLAAFPIRTLACYDVDAEAAKRIAGSAMAKGLDVTIAGSARSATERADIVVTCTVSRVPILDRGDVQPGCFIAAVGADAPGKHEIAPELMHYARVVPDVLAQALVMGDLHHAIDAGTMRAEDVHGELADVVSGRIAGRTHEDELFVFDSTGTAIADLAAANAIFELACADAAAPRFRLAA